MLLWGGGGFSYNFFCSVNINIFKDWYLFRSFFYFFKFLQLV